MESEWRDCSKAYDLIKTKQYYSGRSDLTLPTIANLVERLVPRVVRATVGRDDFFECVPNRPEDADKTETNAALVRWQLEADGFRRKYPAVVRDACIYGTGIWKARWKYEVRQGDGAVLFDGPSGDPLDIFNVWVDPRARDFDRTDVVEKMSLNYTECKRLERLGIFANVDAILKNAGKGDSHDYLSRSRKHGYEDYGTPEGFYDYIEFWGDFALDAENEFDAPRTETVPCVIGILAGKVVRIERNPFSCQRNPYFKAVLLERTGEFYGVSLVKKCLNLWVEQNDSRNQANDARSFAVCPVMLRAPGPQDKKTSQRIFPGAVITGNNLQFAAFPDVTTPVLRWEPVARRDMEETLGAPSLLDAQSESGSATEASIQQTESGVRIAGYAHCVEDIFIVPYLQFIHSLNQQYLNDDVAVRIKGFRGFDFRPITPQDVEGNFTFVTVGASSMARGPALTAQFLQTMDRMLVIEQMAPGSFDLMRFWETYLREALDIAHPEMYIKALRHAGRVPTVDEVHLMLMQGQRVEPDPRQDFASTLPQYGAYLAKVKDALPPQILKLFIAHLLDAEAVAREVLAAAMAQRQQALIAQSELAMKQQQAEQDAATNEENQQMKRESHAMKMSGSNGGASQTKRDDSDRDGHGMSTARQAMKHTSQGTAGRQG